MMQIAAHEAAAVHAVPLPHNPWCLFLDVDGTLLELAATPDAVVVDPALPSLLTRLRDAVGRRGGAGQRPHHRRSRSPVRRPRPAGRRSAWLRAPRRARHAARRGRGHRAAGRGARRPRTTWSARHPGLMLEDKGAGLALHFQGARTRA